MEHNLNKKIGLALSGGGYRAAAYHIGVLRALNRLGILDKVDVISSVSGGSITAAYYALHKENYEKFEQAFISKLQRGVLFSPALCINLIAVIALFVISVWVLGWWILLPGFVLLFCLWFKILPFSVWIEKAYNKHFFKNKKLSDFPVKPLIAINSTDIATGTLFTFSQTKMSSYKYEEKYKKIVFKHEHFPIARAVMASSCVPFAFSPIKISDKYCKFLLKKEESPLLIDGGLYDNQGAHKLTEEKGRYYTQLNIVSDACANEMNAKWAFNIPLLLVKTSNIMMNRIKNFQLRNNIYAKNDSNTSFAYLSLKWETGIRPIESFVKNIKEENITKELLKLHRIEDEDIKNFRKPGSIGKTTKEKLIEQLKSNIGWEYLKSIMPTPEEDKIAKKVGTNLTALKESQINALIKYSNWLAEVQIRLYLPHLITK